MQARALKNKNPNVFIRSVMGGMILKMFACIIAVFIYVQLSGADFNKRSIFTALCLYLVYLAVEVRSVMKLNRNKNA
jgi:high-affinity Fe2+/Pb2+ permease